MKILEKHTCVKFKECINSVYNFSKQRGLVTFASLQIMVAKITAFIDRTATRFHAVVSHRQPCTILCFDLTLTAEGYYPAFLGCRLGTRVTRSSLFSLFNTFTVGLLSSLE